MSWWAGLLGSVNSEGATWQIWVQKQHWFVGYWAWEGMSLRDLKVALNEPQSHWFLSTRQSVHLPCALSKLQCSLHVSMLLKLFQGQANASGTLLDQASTKRKRCGPRPSQGWRSIVLGASTWPLESFPFWEGSGLWPSQWLTCRNTNPLMPSVPIFQEY